MTLEEIRVVRILWFALFFSLGIYGAIVVVLARGWEEPAAPLSAVLGDPIVLALYGAGLMSFALGWILPAKRLQTARGAADVRAAWIVRWVLFESVAIYGLLAVLLRLNEQLFIPAALVSALGFILSFPSES
ncbi:MAG TPA: hypothetical protein VIL97_08290 [Thermoanaerobaculia bacterium]